MGAFSRRIRRLAGLGFSLVLAGCAGASQQAPSVAARAAEPPNIIVILADDLGYADISAYGVKRIATPNIDRIGREGAIFTDGYTTAPVCSPARAALQTGRYQQRFGFEYNNGPPTRDAEQNLGLPAGEITIASALKARGYRTALVGKWHLGANPDFYPTNRGYDEFVGILAGATSYMDANHPDVVVAPTDDAPDGGSPGPRGRFTQVIEGPERTVVRNEREYLTDYLGRRSVEFIRRGGPGRQPYFLYASFTAPHAPFMVTRKYYDRFAHIEDRRNRIYAGMIAALDDAVGEILQAVEASGEAENTLIYFVSDNGCAAYVPGLCACEPLRGGKLTHYEGGVRVPFLMRWPAKVKAGTVYRKPVSTLDIFPTALAGAGARLPGDRAYDGVDITPYLQGVRDGDPHPQLMWRRQPLASIRKGDWKLWKDPEAGYTLLFDLKRDPNETTNLAVRNPAKVRELEADIDRWARDLQDPRWPSRPPVTYNVCGTPFKVPI